jgi:acyl-coenzyme A thioesterase PaaI-like protein
VIAQETCYCVRCYEQTTTQARGALLALLADVHLGRLCAMSADPPLALVTSGLTLNCLSAAKVGDWLEASGQVDRVGRTLAHSTGVILANGKPVLRACGTFQIQAPAQ